MSLLMFPVPRTIELKISKINFSTLVIVESAVLTSFVVFPSLQLNLLSKYSDFVLLSRKCFTVKSPLPVPICCWHLPESHLPREYH